MDRRRRARAVPFRVGHGFDLHRLTRGGRLVLGGVDVATGMRAVGHSDADAALHALADAVFGAAGCADIGDHYPDSFPETKGLDSSAIVRFSLKAAAKEGWRPVNADVTVLLERPRLGPRKAQMRLRIAEILALDPSAVSVKAKGMEGLGEIGTGRAVGAMAAVLLTRAR